MLANVGYGGDYGDTSKGPGVHMIGLQAPRTLGLGLTFSWLPGPPWVSGLEEFRLGPCLKAYIGFDVRFEEFPESRGVPSDAQALQLESLQPCNY